MSVILTAVVAWAIAQIAKMLIQYAKTNKVSLSLSLASGGMPSSHSAFVSAAATKIALLEGLSSPTFGAIAIFSFIVMYDAVNVRQSVGIQAKALNNLFYQLENANGKKFNTIKEVCGHNLLQVIIGLLLGILVGFLF